nr:immunoglobulin heavy chain junction region [Mus musculus]NSM06589.1 immunoglobulin heavy chain junction region [Mus musculus]NSM08230.1 immunoglobulin heavy chain junction region [Mus musculus]
CARRAGGLLNYAMDYW